MDGDIVNREIEKISEFETNFEMQKTIEAYTKLVMESTMVILEKASNPREAIIDFYSILTKKFDFDTSLFDTLIPNFINSIDFRRPQHALEKLFEEISERIDSPVIRDFKSRVKTILNGECDEKFIKETIEIGEKEGFLEIKTFLIDYLSIVKNVEE